MRKFNPDLNLAGQPADSTIQKLKQQYNQSGSPALEVTLAEVQEDLRRNPPQVIQWDEVELTNGIANGHMEQGPGSGKSTRQQLKTISKTWNNPSAFLHTSLSCSTGQNVRLEPVTAPGILSLVLNIMCASLNIIRGVHLIEYTFQVCLSASSILRQIRCKTSWFNLCS